MQEVYSSVFPKALLYKHPRMCFLGSGALAAITLRAVPFDRHPL